MEREITIEFNGANYKGYYEIEHKIIRVSNGSGLSKSTQLGGLASVPETLARMLLHEIALEETKNKVKT